MRRLAAVAALIFAMLGLSAGLAVTAPAAHAAVIQPSHAMAWGGSHAGNVALNWATTHTYRHTYVYGAAGPYSYDCSGLVMVAFAHAGVSLPHGTYPLLYPLNRHLHRVTSPQRGDLAFFGSGHVEIVTAWWHTTYGAHNSASLIGWRGWNGYYAPTAYYRVW